MLSGRLNGCDALGKFFERDPHLQPRQPHPQAHMWTALPERNLAVRGASEVNPERRRKGGFVTIPAGKPVENLFASLHDLAVKIEIACGGAAEIAGWAGATDYLIGHGVTDLAAQ